jgi:hypothetical protein
LILKRKNGKGRKERRKEELEISVDSGVSQREMTELRSQQTPQSLLQKCAPQTEQAHLEGSPLGFYL